MAAYVKQTWLNGVAGATPLSASRLSHIESGLELISRKGDNLYDVRDYAGWDSIAANNDVAYQSAINDAYANGGGNVLLPPLLKLATGPEVLSTVNLVGRGSSQEGGGSVVQLTTSTARVKFGNNAVGSSGGISSGFRIDCDDIANIGLYVGCTVGRSFKNIDIVDAVDAAQVLEATQNCSFEEVNIQRANDLIRLDRGAGSNSFGKCEYGGARRYNVNIEATTSSGLPIGVQAAPLNNVWHSACIFEYDTATTQAVIRVSAGSDNAIIDSIIVALTVKTLIKLEVTGVATSALIRIRGGTLQFNTAHADNTVLNMSGNTRFFQEGKTAIAGATTIGRYDGGLAIALWDNPVIPAAATWSVLTNAAQYYNIRSILDVSDIIAPGGAGTVTGRQAVWGRDGTVKGWLHVYDV